MELTKAIEIAALGMKAQGTRMRVISENIANSQTTATNPDELPYQRQLISFKNVLDKNSGVNKVQVDKIFKDQSDFKLKYDPEHPAADEKGYIKLPNVNRLLEVMDMQESQRSFEANLGVIETSKAMLTRSIDMLRA